MTSQSQTLKYGLTSQRVVLSFEDPGEFAALRNGYLEHFQPATAIERFLVDDITAAEWRIMRVESAQKTWIEKQAAETGGMPDTFMDADMARFHKYETSYRRAFESAWRKLEKIQRERKAADTPAPSRPTQPKIQNEPKPAPAITPASPITTAAKPYASLTNPSKHSIFSFAKRNPGA
jgi:hypothetical protein